MRIHSSTLTLSLKHTQPPCALALDAAATVKLSAAPPPITVNVPPVILLATADESADKAALAVVPKV